MGYRTTSQEPRNNSSLLNKQSPGPLAFESSGCGQSSTWAALSTAGPLVVLADTISQDCGRHPVTLMSLHLMGAEAEGLRPCLKKLKKKKKHNINKQDNEIL